MPKPTDAFAHHPELRDRVADPLRSRLRNITVAELTEQMSAIGVSVRWWHTDEEREASRRQTLSGRRDGDIWVFAYGSLMWDPAFLFDEVRRAHAPDYARRFILKDIYGGRGTAEMPGLMAALDHGDGCDGLAFRIARDRVDAETEIIWRREKIGPAYKPVFVETRLSDRNIEALAFVADHTAKIIDDELTRAEQVRFLATGTGLLGSSLDYLRNIAEHLATLGIEDQEVLMLMREVESFRRTG